MPNSVLDSLEELGRRIDEDLLASLVAAASVSTAAVRQDLEGSGLAWYDPEAGRLPAVDEIERSADAVVRLAGRTALVRGGVAGAAGLLALPPELVAALVQSLRLAQRLAVIYGHDPETDRGKVVLYRALAAAFDVELPRQARLGLRVRDLAALWRGDGRHTRATTLARTVAARMLVSLAGRVGRVVPGVGAGVGAWDARRSLHQQAARMRAVYRQHWEGALLLDGPIEDAVEVEG